MRDLTFAVLLALMVTTAAGAAVAPISESFQDGSLPAGFNLASDSSNRAVDFTASGAVFDPGNIGDNGRNYIRTDRTDYHVDSFEAYVTVSAEQGSGYGEASNFFLGLGTGQVGQYGVPDRDTSNDSVIMEFNGPWNEGDGTNSWWAILGYGDPALDPVPDTQNSYPEAVGTQAGPHRLRLAWDAATNMIEFSVDYLYDGETFAADQSASFDASEHADATNGWAAGDSSSVFFGGDQSATASDFLLVPAPAPLALLAAGAAALLRRRR